jgi:hypothetical protein
LPITKRARSPRPRSRSIVSGDIAPGTTSPPTTITSGATTSTSASTASSAGRLPWMSYSAAIRMTRILPDPGGAGSAP